MAFHKLDHYPLPRASTALFARLLAHPERIEILTLLSRHGELSMKYIAKHSPLAYPTVSQHLKILREGSLVSAREEYPLTYYRLNHEFFKEASYRLNQITRVIVISGDNDNTPDRVVLHSI